ncbi:hypothetical protein CLHOM_19290 [Clostridium homopropionicum DSM 5847]|uniref:DUF2089 domain-containing protein n=1 Tax=Clostridium homopropionicum DSM 5847 TaxID=1121318 RepID=A0A0L6ZA41_9CLOT|nr:DUF2089 domain-containing protein [Clostridium homopropionicum]KOA19840.1 hypothetical protein CLHOM_19290 [Clostridium homopropionicum DSM 5847]SFF76304.1 hypothetical protein SAMN04488501_10263 [Clostridium homopropionicum]
MGYKVLSKCPVCSSNLKVTKLKCNRCGTIIENEFELSKFAYLTSEQLEFAEVFIKSRGNIKDVEKEMGISYPTVRAKLDDVILALGYSLNKKPKVTNKEVLDMLEKGEISPEEALKALKDGDLPE